MGRFISMYNYRDSIGGMRLNYNISLMFDRSKICNLGRRQYKIAQQHNAPPHINKHASPYSKQTH